MATTKPGTKKRIAPPRKRARAGASSTRRVVGLRPRPVQATEHQEQAALIRWVDVQRKHRPELDNLFAIPNGGDRHILVAKKLRAEGVRRGLPDIMLSYPCGKWHGLFIEMKRQSGGRLSPEQKEWAARLGKVGYQVATCHGWIAAKEVIEEYLTAPVTGGS